MDHVPEIHQLLLSLEEDPRLPVVCDLHPRVRQAIADARQDLVELVRLEREGALSAIQAAMVALRIRRGLQRMKRRHFPPLLLGGVTLGQGANA